MVDVTPTTEAVEEQIDDLRYVVDEIEGKQQALCEGCEAIRTLYEPDEYWGFRCMRPAGETCPVDFDAGASGCHKGGEYEELEDAKEAALREIGELSSLDVEVFAEGVAG